MKNNIKTYYWNLIAKEWNRKHHQRLWRIHSDKVNSVLLDRWLSVGVVTTTLKTDLFDEAFGRGLFPILASRSENIIGIDISPLIVNTALDHNKKIHGATADVRYLPFHRETFDTIISISSLDHFHTQHGIIVSLREIRRVLRKGGQLIITLDNLSNPVIALRRILPFSFLNKSGLVPYYVGATMTYNDLYKILEHLGFEVTELSAILHAPRILAIALARIFEKYAEIKTQKIFLQMLMAFESLSRWPTRYLTGYFIAVNAIKR